METDKLNSIITMIYDAAIDSEQWIEVMQHLQEILSSIAIGQFTHSKITHEVTSYQAVGIEKKWLDLYKNKYAAVNPWLNNKLISKPGVAFTDNTIEDLCKGKNVFSQGIYYKNWMKPQGFNHKLCSIICNTPESITLLSFFRNSKQKNYNELDYGIFYKLSPHLCRATKIINHFEEKDNKLIKLEGLIENIDCGIILIDENTRTLEANQKALKIIQETKGVRLSKNKITCQRKAENNILKQYLNELNSYDSIKPVTPKEFRLESRSGQTILSALIIQIHIKNDTSKHKPTVAMIFKENNSKPKNINKIFLKVTYKLSPLEVRLTQELLSGNPLKRAASDMNISYETARWYIKKILKKTGTHRQSELIRCVLTDFASEQSRSYQASNQHPS